MRRVNCISSLLSLIESSYVLNSRNAFFVSKSIVLLQKDGNLGLGLYIGPHCMQMAIDKAKKHGVGFVACKNSTVRLQFQLSHCRSVGSIMFDFSS